MRKKWQKFIYIIMGTMIGIHGLILNAYAADTGMPWEGPLEKILAVYEGEW